MDNFEHLLAAIPDVLALLNTAQRLKLMITSRISLHLRAESVVAVQGMGLIDKVQVDYTELDASDAVLLFMDTL